MRLLYTGNVLLLSKLQALSNSSAGLKYELSLLESLCEHSSYIDVISLSRSTTINNTNDKVFHSNSYKHIPHIKIPIIADIVRGISYFIYLFIWAFKYREDQKKLIILNSPFGIILSALIIRSVFKIRIFSLTIDTPISNIHNDFKVYRLYQKALGKTGHYLLKFIDGIIVFNQNVLTYLNLKIAYHLTRIGFDLNNYKQKPEFKNTIDSPRKIYFTGTLIEYNGIKELLEAFIMLKRDFELHIYGDGPLKHLVNTYAAEQKNIFYYGIVENIKLLQIINSADLLINPRKTESLVNDFGFPSKLIEYILSGNPVLTTQFGSLPDEYQKFLYIIDDESPQGIKNAIEEVFKQEEYIKQQKCIEGYNYIISNNNWSNIAYDILEFVKYT